MFSDVEQTDPFHLVDISQKLLSRTQFNKLKIFGEKEQERRASFPTWLERPTPSSDNVHKVIKQDYELSDPLTEMNNLLQNQLSKL